MAWTSDVHKRVLPTGLTLLAQRDGSARVVAAVTHVKAGYFDEPDEWVGIAHVLEHMFFKGTARRGPGAIARETQLLGGYLNAHTIYDKTVYYTVLPSGAGGLERALDIQADALMHTALDADELGRELEVIIQEAKRKLDNPWALATETLYELLFSVHRMRRWRIGTEAGLRALSADDVRQYHATRYVPARTIVALVGDLDPERALDLAVATYGTWQGPAVPIEGSPPEPSERHAVLRVISGDIARPFATLGWRTVGALHPDTPALDVLAGVLGAGRGSRLWRGVRAPGLASGVGASHYTPPDVGVFSLEVETEADLVEKAVERSLAIAERLAAGRPGGLEIERVSSLAAAEWARRFEGVDGRATALCEFEALGDYRLADTMFARIQSVTPEDVVTVAGRYLAGDGLCGVLSLPRDVPPPIDARHWPPPVSRDDGLPAPSIGSSVCRVPGGGAFAARRTAGEVTHAALDAVDLVVAPKRGAGLVALNVLFPGMRDTETAPTAGLAALLARSSLRGAGVMDATALAFAAERLGGAIAASVTAEGVGFGMVVPPEALAPAADLLVTTGSAAILDDQAVAAERALLADDAARARDDMFRYPVQRALAQAFPGHPYGLPIYGEAERVGRLPLSAVRQAAERMRACRPVVVAVGDASVADLLAGLAPLGRWPGGGAPRAGYASPEWTAGRSGEQRDKAQTALALAFPGPSADSSDRFAAEILCAILSGLAGRLFDALRERRALAYTVTAMPWLRARGGAIVTYIATSPEREDEARDAMLAELRRVAREPVDPAELERARQYAAGVLEIRRQHAAARAAEMVDAWVVGTWEELSAIPDRLRSVTAAEVMRVAAESFDLERRAEYAVRGVGKSR